jgi:hypothetical protein
MAVMRLHRGPWLSCKPCIPTSPSLQPGRLRSIRQSVCHAPSPSAPGSRPNATPPTLPAQPCQWTTSTCSLPASCMRRNGPPAACLRHHQPSNEAAHTRAASPLPNQANRDPACLPRTQPFNAIPRAKAADVDVEVWVSLEEVYHGAARKLRVTRKTLQGPTGGPSQERQELLVHVLPGATEGTRYRFREMGEPRWTPAHPSCSPHDSPPAMHGAVSPHTTDINKWSDPRTHGTLAAALQATPGIRSAVACFASYNAFQYLPVAMLRSNLHSIEAVPPPPHTHAGDDVPGMIPADVVFVLRHKRHPRFEVSGRDLVHASALLPADALCGGVLVVPHLDGRPLRVTLAPFQVFRGREEEPGRFVLEFIIE